jgi:hypothetical protein
MTSGTAIKIDVPDCFFVDNLMQKSEILDGYLA